MDVEALLSGQQPRLRGPKSSIVSDVLAWFLVQPTDLQIAILQTFQRQSGDEEGIDRHELLSRAVLGYADVVDLAGLMHVRRSIGPAFFAESEEEGAHTPRFDVASELLPRREDSAGLLEWIRGRISSDDRMPKELEDSPDDVGHAIDRETRRLFELAVLGSLDPAELAKRVGRIVDLVWHCNEDGDLGLALDFAQDVLFTLPVGAPDQPTPREAAALVVGEMVRRTVDLPATIANVSSVEEIAATVQNSLGWLLAELPDRDRAIVASWVGLCAGAIVRVVDARRRGLGNARGPMLASLLFGLGKPWGGAGAGSEEQVSSDPGAPTGDPAGGPTTK